MTGARIYLDYHATTPVDPRVVDAVVHHMTSAFGNANSRDHVFGDEAERSVASAAAEVARLVGAEAGDVIFTSGATEAVNLAIKGFARVVRDRRGRPARIGLMPVEHPAVLGTCEFASDEGLAELILLRVDERAQVDLDDLRLKCRQGLDLLVLMAANNEVGTIYPLEEAAAIAREGGALVFSDATQAAGKVGLDMRGWGVDLLALSAHKMYGPKGVGALVLHGNLKLPPILHGGTHQRGMRSGTLNVPGIAGLGEACRLRSEEMHIDEPRIAAVRDRLQRMLLQKTPELFVNGDLDHRLAGNLHVSYPGIPNTALVARLRDRIAFSTGSACSSGIEAPSHVLQAMKLAEGRLDGALRLGLGKYTLESEAEAAALLLSDAAEEVRLLI